MKTLIETTGGKVIAHGNFDHTLDGRYDAGVHTVLDDTPDNIIPFNPAHDDTYHVWNGSAFTLANVTEAEKEHVHQIKESDFQNMLKEHLVEGTGITITQNGDGDMVISLTQ